MYRKLAVIFVFLLACLPASAFTVIVKPIADEIFPGDTLIYNVIVENDGRTAEDLRFEFSEDPSWSVITQPISHQTSFKIAAGDSETTTIYLTPDESVTSGQKYTHGFKIESNINTISRLVELEVFIRSPDRLTDYIPIVEIDADVDSEIDPRNDGILAITLKNFNPLNISDLIIEVISEINPENNQYLELQLSGLEKKRYEFPLVYDDLQIPTKDKITVTSSVPSRNKTFESKVKTIQILPYSEIQKEVKPTEQFLKTRYDISFFNEGNVVKETTHQMRTSVFRQIFTGASPEPLVVKEGGFRYLVWSFDLAPQESKTIQVTVNFRTLFIVFVALLVAIVLYYIFRSPIVVKKQAFGKVEEHSKVKVLVHVKNRTGKIVDNVNVMDKVPHFAAVNKEFPVGTMQPTKVIQHEKKGTIVKWVIPSLEAYEERIITCYLHSKLKIIGGVRLPAAMVKFKNKMNKFSKVYSPKVSVE